MYHRHKGDDLLSKDSRLQHRWKWHRLASQISEKEIKTWTHFQVSYCRFGNWGLEVTQWGSEPVYYESTVSYIGNHIVSIGGSGETGFKTRIDAQVGAEKLLEDWFIEEYKKISFLFIKRKLKIKG